MRLKVKDNKTSHLKSSVRTVQAGKISSAKTEVGDGLESSRNWKKAKKQACSTGME